MVDIMMISACPEREEVVQAPWKFISRMCINSLEKTSDDPNIHGQNVQILGDCTPDDRNANGTEGQNHGLDRRRIFSSEAERCAVLVVEFVDFLVKRGSV